jgi:hypothetical protein
VVQTNVVVLLRICCIAHGRALAYSSHPHAAFTTPAYPTYRLSVRTVLQEYHFYKPEGMFELKEHLMALSLALLPLYWLLWRAPTADNRIARAAITSFIAVTVWWGFLTGHIINNIRGFGS